MGKGVKHELGQYFTTNYYLQTSVSKLILNKPKRILEPSVGEGDLVLHVQNVLPEATKFDMYEIDANLELHEEIRDLVTYGDFMDINIKRKYKTIIGNPPYVKTNHGNLYIDFIAKCFRLLADKGELIFIVPSDFIKLTSAKDTINMMMESGTFTHMVHPHDEKLFANASIDVIIFRYCKDPSLPKNIILNGENKYLINSDGILTFSSHSSETTSCLKDYFNIYVGMVTGKESVFKNSTYGNITILNDKNKVERYIMMRQFPSENAELNEYMLSNKDELMARKIKRFGEHNWYEWGALRNYTAIEIYMGYQCVYIKTLTREKEVAFTDKVQFFGGGLIMMVPKKRMSSEEMLKVVRHINSDDFKSNYTYSGRFKIGHRQLSNALFEF